MQDFIMAALPLVVAGVALAVFIAERANQKKNRNRKTAMRRWE